MLRACFVLVAIISAQVLSAPFKHIETHDDFQEVIDHPGNATLVLFHHTWARRSKAARQVFTETAEVLTHSDFQVAEIDCDKHKAACLEHHISLVHLPILRLWIFGQGPFVYSHGELRKDEILAWVNHTLKHFNEKKEMDARAAVDAQLNAKNHIHPDPGKVVELNSAVFHHLVHDKAKTTFVLFYSPHCEHCKEVEPLFVRLAEYFKKDTKVLIAKVDVDANMQIAQKYDIKGTPYMLLFPKGDYVKEGIPYKGQREVVALGQFVDNHNSNVPMDDMPHPDLAEMAKSGPPPDDWLQGGDL